MTMLSSVTVIDYGMGNLDSVKRALEVCGGVVTITSDPNKIIKAERLILPGVGAFTAGMAQLSTHGLVTTILEAVNQQQVPLLGICLGMQLLATVGFEGGEVAGLGIIPGEVKLLNIKHEERLPHVGWNEVIQEKNSPIFVNISNGKDFYFVHSYHFVCQDKDDVVAITPFGEKSFISAVQKGRVFGVQFHPEKSQKPGFQLLRNFLAI